MADRLEPKGFWSYTSSDDESADGHLSRLRFQLANMLRLKFGKHPVSIFQDKHAIPFGSDWKTQIYGALDGASFILPIVTPGFLQSEWCCKEILYFREREKTLGRSDLIFPFIYMDIGHVDPGNKADCYDPAVHALLAARQRFDFRPYIDHDADSQPVRQELRKLADAIHAALWRIGPAPRPAAHRPAAPKPFDMMRDIPDGPELVLIPPGKFTMGVSAAENERENVPADYRGWSAPRRSIDIAHGFWLGRYPVTRGQFAAFVAETGYQTPDEAYTLEPDGKGVWTYESRKGRNWRNPGFEQADDHPVVCVNHGDATAYLAWLSGVTGQAYRLPSEAEWEYAARAGTTTARFWGDGCADATRYAKVADRTLAARMKATFDPDRFFDGTFGHPFTAPVGSVLANPFALSDMLGNLWEWTADHWVDHLNVVPKDGSANTTGDSGRRALRGGSWSNSPWNVRAGHRIWGDSGNRDNVDGFRVARTYFPF
jgi:formylglycine-generating enzyme required for sulfatase activity